ncbi:hypothetical protein PAPYR_4140 [Paratrimastix pyriformis]|uniref:COMM domain-containing protein n=1 Tax=Paratrimastix pyriformis TaxID=342808 RepID=A0ABQ8UKL4_9EUKA|nr:hypothetical protein PAPYR_4140 [Paratrimastix pyriformis]
MATPLPELGLFDISAGHLLDFDWKITNVLASDQFSRLCEPLLQLTLYITLSSNPRQRREYFLEFTKVELDKFLANLENIHEVYICFFTAHINFIHIQLAGGQKTPMRDHQPFCANNNQRREFVICPLFGRTLPRQQQGRKREKEKNAKKRRPGREM